MKRKTLRILALSTGLISPIVTFAQQNPTNTSPAGVAPSGQNSQQYWSRAGNNNSIGNNNIFGTLWNSPIYTYTDGTNRTRLNGSLVTNLNGVTSQDVSGYTQRLLCNQHPLEHAPFRRRQQHTL